MILTLEIDDNLIKDIKPKGHGTLIELKVPVNTLTAAVAIVIVDGERNYRAVNNLE